MPSLNTVIKQASRGADLYFVFRFLRLLTMKYEKTDAYKYGIIDKKGKPLKRSSELESVDEKAAYTMLHRLVFKVRRLIEKVPVLGKSILLNYAAALFLLKEQNDTRIWTDDRYMGRKLMEFLENGDWEKEAELLREELKGQYIDTTRSNFTNTMEISVYSFTEVSKFAVPLMNEGGSLLTLTYYGSERVMPHYNVMGVAKAALELSLIHI